MCDIKLDDLDTQQGSFDEGTVAQPGPSTSAGRLSPPPPTTSVPEVVETAQPSLYPTITTTNEGLSAPGGPCVNRAFVPEIEVTRPEETSGTSLTAGMEPPAYGAAGSPSPVATLELQEKRGGGAESTDGEHRADFV